jgi:pSer/pThr/pTyr-binding forkhead associated (FHA) protein
MNSSLDLLLDTNLPLQKEDMSRTYVLDASQFTAADSAKRKLHSRNEDDSTMQISLLLPNHSEPIVIRNKVTITLGRADRQRNAIPTLDLTAENALMLGVSRLHAKILYTDACFYLKDMGSTNGTWLNQQRFAPYQMLPLNHGDQIRLGDLPILIL